MTTSSADKDPLSHLVIGKAMEVHRELGPGIKEEFYHRLLSEKLIAAGVAHQFKPRTQLIYRGQIADEFEPDIVIPNRLIPELKAIRGTFAPNHFSQLLVYLKFWKIPVGLLVDFAKESLIFKRVIAPKISDALFPEVPIPAFVTQLTLAEKLIAFLREIYRDHGVGYRETTYRGLLLACLKADGVEHTVEPVARIQHLGPTSLKCIQIAGQCAVTISALGDGLVPADRAILQTYLRWLEHPWGIAIHFGKKHCDVRFVKCPTDSSTTRRFRTTTD